MLYKNRRTGMRRFLILLIPVFFALTAFLLFRFVFIIGYIPSASMEPTLKEDSFIFGVRVYDDIEKGDIVIFRHNNIVYVKRVAAVGGEEIEVGGSNYKVPNGCYFMLGDNTENSYDSRYWEEPFVKASDIIAKVIV